MANVSALPINEKILFHAHMIAQLCEGTNCPKCPLAISDPQKNSYGCLMENMGWPDGRLEIERRFQDARNKREKE